MDGSTVVETQNALLDVSVTTGNVMSSSVPASPSRLLRPLSSLLPLTVFNFHHVEDTLSKESRKHITISSAGLRQFIRKIRQLGFEPISLKAVYQSPHAYALDTHKRWCLITFDDGLVNNLQYALPVLEAEKCPATIFALPGKFGGTNDWDEDHLPVAQRDALMTKAQMQMMAASPYITFGSHGLYHSHLGEMKREGIRRELHESHEALSNLLGRDYVPVFAYPWGEYSALVVEEMPNSPYEYAFTVENGVAMASHNPFLLPRFTVFWRDGNPLILHAKLFRHGIIQWCGKLKAVSAA
jgi:peptidoglycan/xylan/chitin deacetylase (PgdA/CDA1 family)